MSQRPEPGFVFMVFHYPEAGQAEALAAGMREMGAHLAGQPGLIDVRFYLTTAAYGPGRLME